MEKSEILKRNHAFYLDCASHYDRGREHFFANDLHRVQEDLDWILSPLQSPAEMQVVDMGCGTGFFSQAIALRGGRRFHCVDLNDTFLESTRKKLEVCGRDVQASYYRTDFESFARDHEGLLEEVDLLVMGSVLQYVPGHGELLRELAERYPHLCFYITNTNLPGPMRKNPVLENVFSTVDYRLHRWWHRPPRGGRAAIDQVRVEVRAEHLHDMFHQRGYSTHFYYYTTFHTEIVGGLHRRLKSYIPSLGSSFTLIARLATEAGEESRNEEPEHV